MVSPRTRAQRTFELLFAGVPTADRPKMQIDERVREWTYGDYEGPFPLPPTPTILNPSIGKLKEEVSAQRGAPWDIWTQGCAGGESAEQMCVRADDVVRAIRDAHRTSGKDVLLVSHGHFSRVFLARWLGLPLPDGQKFVLDPGGVRPSYSV
jgi:broad specificity phosphatase PhoE